MAVAARYGSEGRHRTGRSPRAMSSRPATHRPSRSDARLRHVLQTGLEHSASALPTARTHTPIGAPKRALEGHGVPYSEAYSTFERHYEATLEQMMEDGMWPEQEYAEAVESAKCGQAPPLETVYSAECGQAHRVRTLSTKYWHPKTWDRRWWPPVRTGPDANASPIDISVFIKRRNRFSESEGCNPWQENGQFEFYIHCGANALLAGGRRFRDLLDRTRPVQLYKADDTQHGYETRRKESPPWIYGHGWQFPCVFLGAPPMCVHEMVVHNWRIAALWHVAVTEANIELKSKAASTAGHSCAATLRIHKETLDCELAHEGVIGWDIGLEVPDWLERLFPKQKVWRSPNFPSLRNGRLRFHRGGQTPEDATRVLAELVQHPPWNKLVHPVYIYCTGDDDDSISEMQRFLTVGSAPFAVAGWDLHARILVRDDVHRVLRVYDPWKRDVEIPTWLSRAANEDGAVPSRPKFSVIFMPREGGDQAFGEGSCVLQATSRVMLAALYGVQTIWQPWSASHEQWMAVPVAVQLLTPSRVSTDMAATSEYARERSSEWSTEQQEVWLEEVVDGITTRHTRS